VFARNISSFLSSISLHPDGGGDGSDDGGDGGGGVPSVYSSCTSPFSLFLKLRTPSVSLYTADVSL